MKVKLFDMTFRFSLSLICFIVSSFVCTIADVNSENLSVVSPGRPDLVTDLTDSNWDQIQKGEWLIGFFDRETEESRILEENWHVFAIKCQEQDIKVGKVYAPDNPGLYVRFLVTVFPKAFYIKNGVAHEVPKVDRNTLIDLIRNKRWNKLKPVNFLNNPFSVQMSLLSHLFIHAVNLYNFEHSIVQKFLSAPSATDIVFGLTFITVGTFFGLLLTCAFGVLQIFFMDSKDSEYADDDKKENEDKQEKDDTKEESPTVRKRK